MKIVFPLRGSYVDGPNDLEFGDLVIHTTYIAIGPIVDDENTGEKVAYADVLGVRFDGVHVMSDLDKFMEQITKEPEDET